MMRRYAIISEDGRTGDTRLRTCRGVVTAQLVAWLMRLLLRPYCRVAVYRVVSGDA